MKITGDYIFTEDGQLVTDMCIITDEDGNITDLEYNNNDQETIRYEGIIVPGLFNCHSHLEIASVGFGNIDGLGDFLNKMKIYQASMKETSPEVNITKLDTHLYKQGIEFCADVSNSDVTIPVKEKSKITYFSFIEIFESLLDDPEEKFQKGLKIEQQFLIRNLKCFVVPHSLYSISKKLIQLLSGYNHDNKGYSSIHFKESFKENELYDFQNEIYKSLNTNYLDNFSNKFSPSEILHVLNELFHEDQRIVFVHNIYMNEKERIWLSKNQKNCALCICPSSNLNIEKKMTDSENLSFFKNHVFLGTDSSASNPKMSFINEMFLIQQNFHFNLEKIFKMSTIDPSVFFNEKRKGKIQVGNQPGLVLISNADLRKMKLTNQSQTERII